MLTSVNRTAARKLSGADEKLRTGDHATAVRFLVSFR